jgi:lipocalin-like protein
MRKVVAVIIGSLLVAQSAISDDRAKLIGTWRMLSSENELQSTGERIPNYGKNPIGYIIFTPEGRMMAFLEREGRKVPKTDEERAAAFQSMIAYSGIYRVEGDKWITKVDAAWNPAWNGTDQIRFFKVEGERLHVITNWQPNPNLGGKMARAMTSWERIK